jgi:hypothetical protein
MEISWTNYVKNKDVLQTVKKEKGREGRLNGLVTMCVETAF